MDPAAELTRLKERAAEVRSMLAELDRTGEPQISSVPIPRAGP